MRWLSAVFVTFLLASQAAWAGDEVKIKKSFINGVNMDEAELSVTSPTNGTDTHTAVADGTVGEDQVGGDAKVDAVDGETITITETLDPGNAGTYTANLTCDNSASTLNYTPGALTATLDYDDADEKVECRWTNTLFVDPVVTLRKRWQNGVLNDDVLLEIDGTNDDSATSTSSGLPV